MTPRETLARGSNWANRIVLAAHAVLAAFIALRGYPATQDGPAHLYGAHVLWSLRNDPDSPYSRFFSPNLHPAGNSLFSYFAVGLEGHISGEHIASLWLLLSLYGLPLSALAFTHAVRQAAPEDRGDRFPAFAATCLACPLAYNYFFYRGFFNYALSVPLAISCVAAVVFGGAPQRAPLTRVACGIAATVLSLLAALAHPAATVFLLVAVPAAAVRARPSGRIAAAAVMVALVTLGSASRVRAGPAGHVGFSNPLSSVWMIARAVGITHSWFEIVSALALCVAFVWGAVRAGVRVRDLRTNWASTWPAALAMALMVAYFFVPFEFGGAAGLNERIPLFAGMLLIPYVPMTPMMASVTPALFVGFSFLTAAGSISRDGAVDRIREASSVSLIPRGAVIYPVSLQVKLGSISADLGRHLLADLAREHDLVARSVFCGHPAHVLKCEALLPASFDESAIESFEHFDESERQRALRNPASPVRQLLSQIAVSARRADYLVVLGAPALDEIFEHDVVMPLGAIHLGPEGEPVRVYRLPPRGVLLAGQP